MLVRNRESFSALPLSTCATLANYLSSHSLGFPNCKKKYVDNERVSTVSGTSLVLSKCLKLFKKNLSGTIRELHQYLKLGTRNSGEVLV